MDIVVIEVSQNWSSLRGQRTKNNSRTRKGKRKTVANKKK
jgi:ribosomal protein S13